ncbi:hypothetical protein AKJ36_01590 [candidate division MSBL1 archaeon SCGC-AAA259I07]|uniref:Uncharacterized protein n=1 Tax=candidate division MSBL1 archaeon SCGC-AAA259I07 TaxID=1698266 RepID=A0A133ULL7_9EURY|nr:hypothetical protein AKJ36_01590 [candidate division MSBL1 archaeon SCGC-AAA259I07]
MYDTDEVSDVIHEIVVDGGLRERMLTLAREREEGLASREELDEVAERGAEELLDKMEEKFPELAAGGEDRD